MDESKEPTNLGFEKQFNKEQIIDFLGLKNSPSLKELQQQFKFSGELKPWWLGEEDDDLFDKNRSLYKSGIKDPVDPVAVLQSRLKQNPNSEFEKLDLLYSRIVKVENGYKTIPPSAEMIDESVKYLQKIGFSPNPIRGENWVLLRESEFGECYPTIYENIEVEVSRGKDNQTQGVKLVIQK